MKCYKNLVIGGAGAKNYASIGALSVIFKDISHIDRILGVSSGSILATLLCIGCDPEDIKDIYENLNLDRFKINYFSLYSYYKIYMYGGINDPSIFREQIIHTILEKKTGNGNITFKQIYEKYNKVLVIPAACVNKREMFYYNHISNPNMEIKYAIEQSCCVPGIFFPVRYKGNTLVDGGLIDNYPLYYFNEGDSLQNSKITKVVPKNVKVIDTFGILIIDSNVSKLIDDPYLGNDSTYRIGDYFTSVLNTLLTTNSRAGIGNGYWENTIAIDIGKNIDGVSNMVLDKNTRQDIYRKGQEYAIEFLNTKIQEYSFLEYSDYQL